MTILENLDEQLQNGPQSMYDMDFLNDTGLILSPTEYQTMCSEVNENTTMTDLEKDAIVLDYNYYGRRIKIVEPSYVDEEQES